MDHSTARRAMIDGQLRPEAVTDVAVLAAMGAVAREDYVPEGARVLTLVRSARILDSAESAASPAERGTQGHERCPGANLIVASSDRTRRI